MNTPENLHAQLKQELSKLMEVLQLPVRIFLLLPLYSLFSL